MSTACWIALVIASLIAALLVWSFVPVFIVARFGITNPKEKADVEDNYRKTMGQALGAIALITTFAWTFYKDREAINLSAAQFNAQTDQFKLQQDQARDQFVNQQFITAAGLLKEASASTRITGLYAMEQIAAAKPSSGGKNQYLIPVIRAAIGFVKDPFVPKTDGQPVAADIQSAITILGHLNENQLIDVDLHDTNLVDGNFTAEGSKAFVKSDFQGARLYGADMSRLDLTGAKFGGSYMADWEAYGAQWPLSTDIYEATRKQFTVNFEGSNLTDTNFDHVKMGGISLIRTCLAGASFYATDLSRALIQDADVGGGATCISKKNKAYFYMATLIGANFDGVDVDGVSFEATNISGALFSKAKNVDKANFSGACADEKPDFPATLNIAFPSCSPKGN
jgi:uncharacterized protein YjbI with pentapeptide repeats